MDDGGSRRRATIRDVARACGVAPSTVSNALANKPHVAEATRRQILEVAQNVGYRGSSVARALRTQRTFTIGVLLADIANPVFPRIVRGIEDVLIRGGCMLYLCNTDGCEEKQLAYMRSLLDGHVDGLILVSQHTGSEDVMRLLDEGPPFVLIHRRNRMREFDYVGLDNRAGIALLIDHLVGFGHRRIGFIGGPRPSTAAEEREDAYEAALERHGLRLEPDLKQPGDYSIACGRAAADRLLALDRPPTAVIASNDFSALGMITRAAERGVRVPEQLSVTGFDDSFIADLPFANLTTVRQQKRAIGAAAARLLLERITTREARAAREIIFCPELIVRGTTGPPPAAALQRANGSDR